MQVGSLPAYRNLIVIVLIVLELLGGGAYFYYVYQPTQDKIKEKQEIVQKKKREVREIELTRQLLAERKEEIERLKADIARIEKFFPEEVFVPRVLVLIENLALATHVEIENIRPSYQPTRRSSAARSAAARPARASSQGEVAFDSNKEFKTTEVDFKVNGSFQNIYNFMDELATFPKLVVVDRLQLTPAGGETQEETGRSGSAETGREIEVGGYVELNADLPLTFYVQKEAAPEIQYEQGGEAE